jgi:hypothetical protein
MDKSNSYTVQSILFDNNLYTTKQARQWLNKNNYKPIKRVHKTEKYLRYRIQLPQHNGKYIFKQINDGIKLILMKKIN